MVSENEFLVHAFFLGIYITFVYDILRVFRRVVPHSSFWVSAEDLSFWIYCGAKVFLLMYHESDGTLRWFAVMGALTGMLLYRKALGHLFVKYFSLALQKIVAAALKIFKWTTAPFRTAGRKVSAVVNRAGRGLWYRSCRLGRLAGYGIKKRLTSLLKMR